MSAPPLLLVHGIWDSAARIEPLAAGLRARGCDSVTSFDLQPNDGSAPIETLSAQVHLAAERICARAGCQHIDLVGFSMGALASRHYLQRGAGKQRVRRFVSISGPHAGTLTAYALPLAAGRQMRPGSALLRDLASDPDPFGSVQVHCLYTPFDLMILPAKSSILAHAHSIEALPVPMHRLMIRDARVLDRIAQLLRTSCALLALLAAAALSACTRETTETSIKPSDPRIVYTGRFDTQKPDAPRCSWPGSQIEARFTGTSLRALLTDTPVEDELRELDRIVVIIDDGKPKTFALAEGQHVYPLATQLPPGEHQLLIWKRTEGDVGVITFEGFVLDRAATLAKPRPRPSRHLEFVGDSITTGYGDEGRDTSCHGNAAVENNYVTYGAVAARELHASYTAIAYSGKGLTRNYQPGDHETFPSLYERVIASEPELHPVALWQSEPDAVIVNLGTNDFFAGVPDANALRRAHFDLLKKLRARYPKALLVTLLGPMLADDYPQPKARSLSRKWLRENDAQWHKQVDDNLDFLELWFDPAEGAGCDFHPNEKTHARLGRELAALLRTRLDWND